MADSCESQTVQSLITELKRIQCCNSCVLRFINERTPSSYQNCDTVVSKLLGEAAIENEAPEAKTKKANPCSACLGLLQVPEMEGTIEKVVEDVSGAGYDAEEAAFALSLPTALLIRNHSIWLHISEKFEDYYLDRQIYNEINPSYGELKADGNVFSVKEAWKMVLAPTIAERIQKTVNNGVDSKFFVNVNFKYPDNDEETACMAEMHPDIFGKRETQTRKYHNEVFTRKSVEQALEKTSRELFEAHSPVPPVIPTAFISCHDICCCHDSLYLAGRYNKFSRSLSQTPWFIFGKRRMESSVEELISAPIGCAIPNSGIKFSSSGREDVDVRTLGSGRPFVLDVQNPRCTKLSRAELRLLETQINSSTQSVFVRDLQVVPKEDLVHIKTGERMKTKTYHCLCVVRGCEENEQQQRLEAILREKLETLSSADSFVIQQRTPVRVLHRRPLAVRPRTVHWMKGQFSENEGENIFFKLQMKVEAGTYIKELVHGDLGRTIPNVSLLLGLEADILALDVEEVDLPWPPPVDYASSS